MLVVSRRVNQAVVVGEFDGVKCVLKVTVLEARGGKARLGFEVVADDHLGALATYSRGTIGEHRRHSRRHAEVTSPAIERWEDEGGGDNIVPPHDERLNEISLAEPLHAQHR
jgi:hypothetical protein